MRKEQLLNFIPEPNEKFASTNKIARKAKINHYVAQRLLTELYIMDRPLVEKFVFGGNNKSSRDFILWKRTEIDYDGLNKALKLIPKERDNAEHKLICRDKYGGDLHKYINAILVNTVHTEAMVKIE